MGFDLYSDRLAQILTASAELSEFQQWLIEQQIPKEGQRDYLYSEQKARFEPRKDDVVVPVAGLQVRKRGNAVRLVKEGDPPVDVPVSGVARRDVERLLGAMDGERCLLEVRWDAGVKPGTLARFLRATFGLVVFAPAAVAAMEKRLSGVEITRYPGPPYGILRPYWDNMSDVAERIDAQGNEWGDGAELLEHLRELHVLALMGRSLHSFYKPSSPGADRVVAPGALLHDPPRVLESSRGTVFLDGARIKAPLLGGDRYNRLMFEQVGDPAGLSETRTLDEDGLPWGRLITARSEKEDEPGPWFCPPRPIEPAHFDHLAKDLGEARRCAATKEATELVGSVASFHYSFVRLHAFHCANQCLTMSLVNRLLTQTHGAGIPHLVLDHLALRLSRPAFVKVFRRAVDAFLVVDDSPARRLNILQQRKQRSFDLIERVRACAADAEVEALLADDPEAAGWALLASS